MTLSIQGIENKYEADKKIWLSFKIQVSGEHYSFYGYLIISICKLADTEDKIKILGS